MKKLVITFVLVLAACGTHFTGPKGPNAQTVVGPNCGISTSPGVKCP